MRILSYSGESVVTTDGVGEAIVDYARALIALLDSVAGTDYLEPL